MFAVPVMQAFSSPNTIFLSNTLGHTPEASWKLPAKHVSPAINSWNNTGKNKPD